MNTKIRIWFSVLSLVLMLGMSPVFRAFVGSHAGHVTIADGAVNHIINQR
jgi:hypothetical protein